MTTIPTLPPTPSTIANLPLATTPLSGNEFVPISQNGVTKAVAANGFTVVGPQGPAGPTGPTGPMGPAGGAANINTGTIGQLAYYGSTTALSGGDLSGDITTSNRVATLATVNSNVGTFAITTINGKGLVTAAANMTGDVTTSSGVSTLATVNSNVGSFTAANITVNAKGLITAASSGTSGNFVLISTQTISSSTASVSVTSGINSTYSHYIWEISNLVSVSDGVDGLLTVQQGGSFVGGTNYNSDGIACGGGAVTATRDSGTAQFNVTGGKTAIGTAEPGVIRIEFWNPSIVAPLQVIFESVQAQDASTYFYTRGGGTVKTSAATTGIKLVMSSGNIATCTANLYGIT